MKQKVLMCCRMWFAPECIWNAIIHRLPSGWPGWHPQSVPAGQELNTEAIWCAYDQRWPIEPGFLFAKETLGWTMPMFQSKEAGDRWTEVQPWQPGSVYTSSPLVEDLPLPLATQQR